jgi:CheY-like chemotaxis protein
MPFAPPRPLAVLVVDDDPDTALSLAAVVALDGHDARHATSGEQALGLLDGWRPDAALLDLSMPGLDGYALAERLRRQFERRPLLVAVTGHGQLQDFRRSHTSGFDRHLLKPASPRVVADLLREYAARLS